MYIRIKENIVNPRRLLNRKNDKFGISFLYFLLLVIIMSLPSVISSVSFKELSPNNKTQVKVALEEQLNIPCTIDYGLTCETDEVYAVEVPNLNVYFDPAGLFIPETFGINVVLREDSIYVFSARQVLYTLSYGTVENPTGEIPSEWTQIEMDPSSDIFWDNFFLGLDSLIMNYRSIWLPISLLSGFFVIAIVLLTEILIDTLIVSLFRIGRMKFRETFKVILNAMTLYVIISVILELYSINVGSLIQTIFQMIPLFYVLIAVRIPIKR